VESGRGEVAGAVERETKNRVFGELLVWHRGDLNHFAVLPAEKNVSMKPVREISASHVKYWLTLQLRAAKRK